MRVGVGPDRRYNYSSIATARLSSYPSASQLILLSESTRSNPFSSYLSETNDSMAEKHDVAHAELQPVTTKEEQKIFQNELTHDQKGNATAQFDYSGAHAKTDPREIALVKKLDRWIMPM